MKIKLPLKIAGLALLPLITTSALAITLNQLPGSVFPEQVRESFTSRASNQKAPKAPLATPAPAEKSLLGPKAKKVKFVLNGIILEGNSTYKTSDLSLIYKNKLHKSISVAELFDIVQNITNYYRNNGYIVTRAILPPQRVKNGVVRVKIIEGFVDKVNVSNNPHRAADLVQAYGMQIARCKPLQMNCMERYLLIANEIPATRVKAVLTPAKKTQGAADLTLMTVNQPITGYLSYDNYGTRFIGPQQMTANVAFNSWITSGDSTQFTLAKTPKGQQLTYGDVNYNMALSDHGTRFLVGATRVKTHPLFILEPTKIDGVLHNYYTSVQYPLIRSRTENLTLQAGFNYLDSEVTSLDGQQALYNDHLRSLDFGASYNFSDRWYGLNFATVNLRKGLPILGYTSDTSLNALTSRPGGHANYTKLNTQVSRLQSFGGPISMFGVLRAQWSFNPLLAAEQFSFGGNQLGRGYDMAEIIGDKGVGGSIELRYELGVNKFLLRNIQFYTFYDIGKAWNDANIVGITRIQSAASAGLGARLYFAKYLTANLMWAQPLTKSVSAEEYVQKGHNSRVFFSLVAALDGNTSENNVE